MSETWKSQSRVLSNGSSNGVVENKNDAIVEQMEKEWPEMTSEFKKLQKEQYELFCHKQHDYGPGNISVGTQLKTKEEINLSLTGLWFRMNDKLQRVKTLLLNDRQSAVQDIIDTEVISKKEV